MTPDQLKWAIRTFHGQGMTDRQIADALGEDRRRINQFRQRLGLPCNPGTHLYSRADAERVRRQYGTVPTRLIASGLGVSVSSVYQLAKRLGLSSVNPHHGRNPRFVAFVRECHAKGWSDAETAAAWGCNRRCVEDLRHKLGLPHNAYSTHRRRKVAAKTAEQLRKAGLPSIGHLRVEAFKQYARERGWPEDLKPRQVQILELLWDNGPMTREEIGQRLGLRKKPRKLPSGRIGHWYPMHCNTPGHGADTSYTGDLLRRGLIISLGRVVRNRPAGARNGQGHNTVLYSLPLTIERKNYAKEVS